MYTIIKSVPKTFLHLGKSYKLSFMTHENGDTYISVFTLKAKSYKKTIYVKSFFYIPPNTK